MYPLRRLTIRGFRSIGRLEDFELGNLNVLIGANGAGKSNFISLFRMLAELMAGRLQVFVQQEGGPDALLFGGRKRTARIEAKFRFGDNGYEIALAPAGDLLVFAREDTQFFGDWADKVHPLGSGHHEARLPTIPDDSFAPYVRNAISAWRVYHFHDTGRTAAVRVAQSSRDNIRLKSDAGNLAPFLRRLRERHPTEYERIVQTIRLVAPFFGDFVYRTEPGERIELEWFHADDPDTPFGPLQLSDGTLRFICLATLLLQPAVLQPATILIDEPELGLHPYALGVLAALLKQAAESRQLIVSTQSVELINALAPEDVIVVNRKNGGTSLERPDPDQLKEWLNDYTLGELWQSNVIGGRPAP